MILLILLCDYIRLIIYMIIEVNYYWLKLLRVI